MGDEDQNNAGAEPSPQPGAQPVAEPSPQPGAQSSPIRALKQLFVQALKFGLVGVVNTLSTLLVIYVLTEVLALPLVAGNLTGYAVGLCISFLLNRSFTFQSRDRAKRRAVVFLLVFFVCYGIQLTAVYGLLALGLEAFPAQLGAMLVYTPVSFLLNRYVTFRK